MDYKHYIRVDAQDRIIAAFSDAFQAPQDEDIMIAETDERHFNLDIYTPEGMYRYEYDGEKIIQHSMTAEETVAMAGIAAEKELRNLDSKMIRGIDDLIGLLIEKNVIAKNELPAELSARLEEREILRIK